MANGTNVVVLGGRLGKDAETKFTQGGTSVTKFSIAVDRGVKDGEGWKTETDWHDIVAFKQEGIANYLLKGADVTVTGRLQKRSYDNKEGVKITVTEIVVNQIQLHGKRESGGSAGAGATKSAASHQPVSGSEITDEDVPFIFPASIDGRFV